MESCRPSRCAGHPRPSTLPGSSPSRAPSSRRRAGTRRHRTPHRRRQLPPARGRHVSRRPHRKRPDPPRDTGGSRRALPAPPGGSARGHRGDVRRHRCLNRLSRRLPAARRDRVGRPLHRPRRSRRRSRAPRRRPRRPLDEPQDERQPPAPLRAAGRQRRHRPCHGSRRVPRRRLPDRVRLRVHAHRPHLRIRRQGRSPARVRHPDDERRHRALRRLRPVSRTAPPSSSSREPPR